MSCKLSKSDQGPNQLQDNKYQHRWKNHHRSLEEEDHKTLAGHNHVELGMQYQVPWQHTTLWSSGTRQLCLADLKIASFRAHSFVLLREAKQQEQPEGDNQRKQIATQHVELMRDGNCLPTTIWRTACNDVQESAHTGLLQPQKINPIRQ